MNEASQSESPEGRQSPIVGIALGLALITVAAYILPISPTNPILTFFKDFLYLAAFILPLAPLYRARQVSDGSEKVAWTLLFAATVMGLLGQITWIIEHFAFGLSVDEVFVGMAQVGFSAWIGLMAAALVLEVSSGGRQGVRAELVIDLMLIGTIGLTLTWEIFRVLPLVPASVQPVDMMIGTANVVASLALGIAALGVLMSPGAMGGGAARLLVVFGAFAAAVARMVFAYELVFGAHTRWLEPVWVFSLLIIAAAGAERSEVVLTPEERARATSRWSSLRPLIVPIIIAYALSLLIRELLGTGGYQGGNEWIAWGLLALLIVARVTIAILGSERQAQEVSTWEHRYETVVQALGEVVYEWDPKSGKLERSGNIAKIFGYAPESMCQSNITQALGLMHAEDREPSQRAIDDAVKRGGWFEIDYRIRHASGSWRLINDRGFCELDEDGEAERVMGIMSDVTEARDGEDRLQRAERLAALGSLAAGAAHEINNPLAAIALAAQVMQDHDQLPDDVREDVRVIERQASRAGEVIDRMLVFARRKEGVRNSVDLNALVRDVLRSRQYMQETHGIKLDSDLQEGLPLVWVDAGQIERALLNLVVNAERALDEVPEGERYLGVSTRPSTIGVAADISDNGPGIPVDVLPRIFDPFFTTREVGEGTGLGLSMSYSIAQSHEGDLRVETRPNKGTTFTLDLPRSGAARLPADASAMPDAAAPAEQEESPESGPRVALRILVVDDEQSVRGLARRFLVKKGHHVDEAKSGKAALRMIQEREYDCVIVDLRMPDLSGEGLYEWLKKNRPALANRVIIISGDIANPDTVEILERIGRPFLLKPFDLDDLLQIVDGFAKDEES
jgi:PAS domain S-box-containing protein